MALVKDIEPDGPPIKDAPQQDGREVGRLPANRSPYSNGVELAEIQVIGAKDGWFLIEGAAYSEPNPWHLYTGLGWVEGKFADDPSVSAMIP